MKHINYRPFPPNGDRLVYEVARDRLQAQLVNGSNLDEKTATFFGLGVGLVAVMSGFLAVGGETPPEAAFVLFSISIDFWILLVGSCLVSYRLTKWEVGPRLEEAWEYARQFDDKALTWWAAEAYTMFYFDNEACVRPKILTGEEAPVWLVCQTAAMVAGLCVFAIA